MQPANLDERAASPWWKSRKWVLHLTYRIFSRYGVPKLCKEGNDRVFSEMWNVSLLHLGKGRVLGLCVSGIVV